jgi:hypothetical protein
MKKNLGIMILTLMTAGVSAVSAADFGGAPVTLNTPVPSAPTGVSTPVTHRHHHHHALSQTGTNTVISTPPAMINPEPMSTPQPITVPSSH